MVKIWLACGAAYGEMKLEILRSRIERFFNLRSEKKGLGFFHRSNRIVSVWMLASVLIAASYAFYREHNLPQLISSRPETGCA